MRGRRVLELRMDADGLRSNHLLVGGTFSNVISISEQINLRIRVIIQRNKVKHYLHISNNKYL